MDREFASLDNVGIDTDDRYACSETDAWYIMDELLETASV